MTDVSETATPTAIQIASDLPGHCEYRRLWDGRSDGVELLRLTVGGAAATICPTRGLGVLAFSYSAEDGTGDDLTELAWESPVGPGPVHPSLVDLSARSGLGWLDGFTELVARCGLSFNGPPGHDEAGPPLETDITLHGRIANLPASGVSVTAAGQAIVVRGCVHEVTLFGANLLLQTAITLDPAGTLTIEDEVSNPSSRPQEMQLLYHINVDPSRLGTAGGLPALTPPAGPMESRDADAEAGASRWTAIDPPTPGYAEQVFFITPEDDGSGTATTELGSERHRLRVHQSLGTLPHLAIWKCFQDRRDGYVLGIEPATGFPNFKADERRDGRVVTLAPGQSRTHRVVLDLS